MSMKPCLACGMKLRSERRVVWLYKTSLRTAWKKTRFVRQPLLLPSETSSCTCVCYGVILTHIFHQRPCINEVLNSIDIVAHGQFGNWCIQHICEHGAPADRSRAIDHVLRYATEYSMDQFASKVVEKCLKIGGTEFLERYLERVCEGRPDRPRIPLIDSKWPCFAALEVTDRIPSRERSIW